MNPMRALRQYQKVNSHAQISEASPHRLIQMLMEGGLDRMAQAKGAMSRGDIPQKVVLITKAIDIITGLRQGMDESKAEDKVAFQRQDSLYEYMTIRLTQANAQNDPEIIDEVARLLITVKSGWDEIAPQ
ncbi:MULTISPECIES: flagellar export chaperone FliS [Pseudomonas]|jgi:flagellar biosynthetic protein FliS|uniref:Flagellar secretion chaperone FliS n=1 Tax=Pseudomonas versuta TaxID=1788301 RepID=A0A854A1S3_9PSED|nr:MULTISPECIES: flagellar export chaperone FliS [Pseudomonas]AMB80357.1 flagellar protein FliS [Pseudomonas fragi]MCB1655935.1 flagellar export chaperone FliS [Pseudomonadales bacterium]NNG60279.1 flagellar export chaperone FliS [Pseudomonas sp. GC01]MCH4869370.1 flagellar export chaperone FliS [Pseudomonas sp. TMW22089]NBG93317.1 flagellar export chaperone FliS [Pseudomonas sp. 9.1(2019)]